MIEYWFDPVSDPLIITMYASIWLSYFVKLSWTWVTEYHWNRTSVQARNADVFFSRQHNINHQSLGQHPVTKWIITKGKYKVGTGNDDEPHHSFLLIY